MDAKKHIIDLVQKFDPKGNPGKILMWLNVFALAGACACNTLAIVKSKETKKEDKKFLMPASFGTGIANIGIYIGMTLKLIDYCKKQGKEYINKLKDKNEYSKIVLDFTQSQINDYKNTFKRIIKHPQSIFKSGDEIKKYIESMEKNLVETSKNGKKAPTNYAKELFNKNTIEGAGVIGTFIGAIIGCSIIAPILRDISAWAYKKYITKDKPEENMPPQINPYSRIINNNQLTLKQPLSMENYMLATRGNLKI